MSGQWDGAFNGDGQDHPEEPTKDEPTGITSNLMPDEEWPVRDGFRRRDNPSDSWSYPGC